MDDQKRPVPGGTTPTSPSDLSRPLARIIDRLGSAEHATDEAARMAVQEVAGDIGKIKAIQDRLVVLWRFRGTRYRDCTLDNFRATTATQWSVLASVRDYAEHLSAMVKAGTGLVLYGPVGTGKDHLLAAVMRTAIEQGGIVVWRSGPAMFARLRDRLDADGASESEWIAELTKPRILAISDPVPPVGGLTNYQAMMLYAVIDERYNHCRPTWVTVNTTGQEDAVKRLTEPILDRLKHGAVVLPCDWASHRKPLPKPGD